MNRFKQFISRPRRQRPSGCIIRLLFVPLLYYGAYMLLRGPLPADPLHIAHRGGLTATPENTFAAFRNAVADGTDVLEFDVQRSADGVLVVIHDETVDRTTDGSGYVSDLTLSELLALDAGGGERIPTFAELIQFAQQEEVVIFPEIKSPERYPGLAADMAAEVQDYGYTEHTVLQSFDIAALETSKAAAPEIRVCTLTGLWAFNFNPPAPEGGDALCPMAEMVILFPWMVRQAHRDGRAVYPYFGVIENPVTMRLLLALGVDGLMVDDPAALAAVLGR